MSVRLGIIPLVAFTMACVAPRFADAQVPDAQVPDAQVPDAQVPDAQVPDEPTASPQEVDGEPADVESIDAVEPVAAQAEMIVVIGAAGAPEYGEMFAAWADQWKQVAENSKTELHVVGDTKGETPDRESLQSILDSIDSKGATPVWLVMIGHGTYSRGVAKFNLRGLDVSAAELSQWLKPIERPVVVVNCASSSGPFVNRLSAPGRVIVTATKSGMEQNFARFGQYFADAIASADSDLDHDDEVSVHEAFVRAAADVQRFYDSEGRLATEHALIDDNGDGKGTPASMFRGARAIAEAKDGAELDGRTASKLTLAPSGNRLPLTEEEWKRRDELEAELETLRGRKSELSAQAYDRELERILIQLAKIYQAAEKRR